MNLRVLLLWVGFGIATASADLVGHWRFDEASGSTAVDSQSANDGSWVPGIDVTPDWRQDGGLLGGAIRFPGNGNHRNYFSIDGFSSLNGVPSGMSVSVWLQPRGASGYRGVLMTRAVTDNVGGTNSGQNYGIGHEADHIDGRVSGSGFDTANGSMPVTNDWIHVAWVWDNSLGNQRVYVNGVQSGPTHSSSSFPANLSFIANGEWRIGDDACCNNRNFDGLMDDLSVWDEALSVSAVNAIYQNGLQGFAADEQAPPPPTEPLNVGLVINEIHYDPEPKTRRVEFIELLNTNETPLDLSGWNFDDGVGFTFPNGGVIPATGYFLLAEDPDELRAAFPSIPEDTVIVAFEGGLSNDGEEISLRDGLGNLRDRVKYQNEFPWPISANGEKASMQLLNGSLDNDLGGAWRGDLPTPGLANRNFTENAPPLIRQVSHLPEAPTSAEAVTVRVKVTDPEGVAEVRLAYQVVAPGEFLPAFLPLSSSTLRSSPTRMQDANPAFEDPANWTSVPMLLAGDSIYEVVLPAQLHRTLVRYRIIARDEDDAEIQVPYADDPSLNFAYFCYDGIPNYTADLDSVHPEGVGHIYDREVLNKLPMYQLITDADHLEQCWAYDSSDRVGSVASRKVFNWEGALVFEGKVYDHIGYRLRQRNDRYAGQGRRSMRFRFRRGNYLAARDPDGELYPHKWRSMNTSKMSRFVERANHGMRELISSRLWNLAGVTAPEFQHVHFRVIDDIAESPDQYRGDFYGLAMIFEDVDSRFLDNRNLEKGNVYKLKDGASNPLELQKFQGRDAVTDASDFINIRDNLGPPDQSDQWLRDHVDWDTYYLYAALGEGFRHYDFSPAFQKNRIWYFRPDDENPLGKMSIIPHDTDATWKRGTNDDLWDDPRYSGGTVNGVSFRGRVVGIDLPKEAILEITGLDGTDGENHPEREAFMLEYRNTIREVYDLFWHPETINPVVDAVYDNIAEFSLADRDRWDKGPAEVGNENIGPLEDEIENIKRLAFVEDRYMGVSTAGGRRTRLEDLANDSLIPETPIISYVGPASFAAGQLRFQSSPYSDPQGSGTFTAMEYRLAEVGESSEWEATWESGILNTFTAEVSPPAGATRVGMSYRARVRHQDQSGRWSHWSEPFEFVAGEADLSRFVNSLVISEVMFLPAGPTPTEAAVGFVEADDFEFIEIRNVGDEAIDLENVRFTKGVDFDFAGSAITTLAPGAYVLVVEDLEAFAFRYGNNLPVAGKWSGGLSRSGERVKLSFGAGETICDFTYGISNPWPSATAGESLTLVHPLARPNHDDPFSWRRSVASNGSPGVSDGMNFSGNGAEEFLQYATGGTPPAMQSVGGMVNFSITLNRFADDLNGRLMVSPDLSAWTPAEEFAITSTEAMPGGFAKVTFTGPSNNAMEKLFFRYEISTRQE